MSKVTRKQPKGTKRAVKRDNLEKTEEVLVDEEEAYGDPDDQEDGDPLCNVGFSVSHTKNLGDYESLRVEVSLHVPCRYEEADEAFDAAAEWVKGKLAEAFEGLGVEVDDGGEADDVPY